MFSHEGKRLIIIWIVTSTYGDKLFRERTQNKPIPVKQKLPKKNPPKQ